MRKISRLVLYFIVFSLLLTLPAVCYAKTSIVLFSTWHGEEPFPSLDLEANTQITQYIYDCSVASGYISFNWAGSETTAYNIKDAAQGGPFCDSYTISFFIGHGGDEKVYRPFPEGQWWVYDNDGNRVYDREIYPYSECQRVRFVFLWSCDQGDTIGGTHWWSGIRYGMPYGWLHTNDLSTDGYASPDNSGYCFIGFDGESPSILREFDGRFAVGYYFLGHFYAAALCGDKTINEALDYASQEVWQVNFGESMLYNGFEWVTEEGETCSGKMVVYGDGNLNIGTSVTAPTLPAPPPDRILTICAWGPGHTDPPAGTYTYDHGTSVTVKAFAEGGYTFGYWYLDGTLVSYQYIITVTMDRDHLLRASFRPQGGASGCPTLFVWNGSEYAEEGFLDIHADSDVTLQHTIEQALVPDKNSYKLSLRELDNFTSHIDQVKLYAVDSDGEMHETHLTNATHSELGDVKELLLHDDDTRVDMTPEQTIDLKFTVPNIDDVAYFTFEINGFNQKTPIDGPI